MDIGAGASAPGRSHRSGVHSAKDVPAELAVSTELVAFPQREDPRDALCGAPSLAALPRGARVGTSSLRRAAQLRAIREDLEVVELRGNVTRGCAVSRSPRSTRSSWLSPGCAASGGSRRSARCWRSWCPPAAGRARAQARSGSAAAASAAALNHPITAACVTRERC